VFNKLTDFAYLLTYVAAIRHVPSAANAYVLYLEPRVVSGGCNVVSPFSRLRIEQRLSKSLSYSRGRFEGRRKMREREGKKGTEGI